MAKWDRALRENALLSSDEMGPAYVPIRVPEGSVTQPDGKPAQYGFGWFLNPYKGHARMWHYGETVGFRTAIHSFREDRLTVVVLCNRSDLDAGGLALRVAELSLKSAR